MEGLEDKAGQDIMIRINISGSCFDPEIAGADQVGQVCHALRDI
jgi:hypothetical protein